MICISLKIKISNNEKKTVNIEMKIKKMFQIELRVKKAHNKKMTKNDPVLLAND